MQPPVSGASTGRGYRGGGETAWRRPFRRMEALDELAEALRARLVERARAGRASGTALESEVRALVEQEAAALPEGERDAVCERVLLLATGLGPLEPLLSDPSVDEIMVNGPGEVYVERRGRLLRTGVEFAGDGELMHAIERVLAPLGRRVDEASPPGDERIVTIEDAAELKLRQRHVVRLESRPANLEGRGEVTIRQLVANALRMRPDRIVVGEVRGPEALDMLQALNTGHDGSLTTVHANAPRDALARIETLALMAGVDLPHSAVRAQVCAAVDVVVQLERR